MTIDTSKLPREVRDRIDLHVDNDNTFFRATEEDYTEELMSVLTERGKPGSNHSFISSMTGMQGCHLKGTKIFVKRGDLFKLINIEDVLIGDEVCSLDGSGNFTYGKVVNNWKYENSPVLKISLKGGNELNITINHKLFTLKSGSLSYVEAGNLKEGDLILKWSPEDEVAESPEKNSDYYFGILHGAYIADGSGEGNISKEDNDVIKYLIRCGLNCGVAVTRRKRGVGVPKWVNLLSLGKKSNKFLRDFRSASFLKGVLDGYILCDSGLNLCVTGIKSKFEVKFISKSEEWINQLQFLLLFFYGVNSWKKIRILRSGNWKGNVYFSLTFSSEDAIKFLSLFEFIGSKKSQKNHILKKHYFQKDARSNYKLLPVEKDFFKLGGTGFSKRGSRLREVCKSLKRCLKGGYFQKMAVRKWLDDFPVLEPYLGKYADLFRFYSAERVESVVEFKGDVFDIEVEKYHKYILGNGVISSNSGKSYGAITLCKILDPDFSIDRVYFDYRQLVYDRAKLKSGTAVLVDEQSEEYGLDSHRINIVLCALKEQLRKKSIHFIFCSPTLKEEYKCIVEDTLVYTKYGFIKAKDLNIGDFVLSDVGKWVAIKNKFYSFKKVYEINTDFAGKVLASGEHRFLSKYGLKKVNDILIDDYLMMGKPVNLSNGSEKDYDVGFFYGAFLADGTIDCNQRFLISKYTGKRVKAGKGWMLRISNKDIGVKDEVVRIAKKYFNFSSVHVWRRGVDFHGKSQVSKIYDILGKNLNEKKMPVLINHKFALGLLNGFTNCDSCININKNGRGEKKKLSFQYRISSEKLAVGISMLLRYFGVYPVVRDYKGNNVFNKKLNKWYWGKNRFYVLFIPTVQVSALVSLLKMKNKWKRALFNKMLRVINNKEKFGFNKGNCKFIESINGGYCAKILSKKAIGVRRCVDLEIDSVNHLYQLGCGLVTHNSSQYIIETMYIDYEEGICYAAYKTRDLLTLGYVKIPHPLNFVTKEFLEAYEAKKDKHLDELTGMTQVDEIEDIAGKIIENDLFKRAELFYRKKIGYIPGSMVVQIINKLYPEFKSSIIVGEVAARIKLNKELDGTWIIPYSSDRKKKKK